MMIPAGMFKARLAAAGLTYVGHAGTASGSAVNLPGGVQPGDTILIVYGVGGGLLTVTGFTETANMNNPHILYKMSASGSEGSSVPITSGTVRGALSVVLRGVDASVPPQEVARVTGGDPPSISPSWGTSKPSAFVAMAYVANTPPISVSVWPNNYTNGQGLDSYNFGGTGTSYGSIIAATRFATLGSDDPSAFTASQALTNARTLVLKGF